MPYTTPIGRSWHYDIEGVRGWKWRLFVYFGDDADIDTGLPSRLLPNFILKSLKLKAGYDTHTLGLPLAGLMELEFNLEKVQNKHTDAFDYDQMNYYLQNGSSGAARTLSFSFGSKAVTIPNLWFLMSNNGDGSTTYSKYEFIGTQEIKPSQKFGYKRSGIKYKISIIGIERSILERITIDDVLHDAIINSNYWLVYKYYDLFIDNASFYASVNYSRTASGLYMCLITDICQSLINVMSVYYKAFWMRTDRAATSTNSVIYPMTYYNNSLTASNYPASAALADNAVYAIMKAYQGSSNIIGGVLVKGSENEEIMTKYDNAWDMLKFWTESHFCKVWFDLNDVSGADLRINAKFLRIFDNTAGAAKVITKILSDELEFEKAAEISIKAISHVNGAKDNDLAEVSYMVQTTTQAEKTFESDLLTHNHSVNLEGSSIVHERGSDGQYIDEFNLTLANVNAVYCQQNIEGSSRFIRCNEECTIAIDSAKTISGGTHAAATWPYTNDLSVVAGWMADRQALNGQGLVLAKAAVTCFGNANQLMIDTELNIEDALPRYIGDNYSITIANFGPATYTPASPFSVPADYPNGNAVLIETEADVIKGTASVKLFVRGD